MKKEIETFDEVGQKITEANLPEVISTQVGNLEELDQKVQSALEKAGAAREAAQVAFNTNAGFFHRKDAIESLQEATLQIGNATADNADSQKMLFDCLQKMAQVEKIILQIGCTSIAMNRSTVRELEAKLQNASKGELSDMARKELESVVRQIRQQQDVLEKQDKLEKNVKTLHEENVAQKSRLDEKDNLDSEQTERIAENKRHLEEKDKVDAEQSQRLEELGALLTNKDLIDQKQEETIRKHDEALQILNQYMKQKDELDKKQSDQIQKALGIKNGNLFGIVLIVISCISLVISCLCLFFIIKNKLI